MRPVPEPGPVGGEREELALAVQNESRGSLTKDESNGKADRLTLPQSGNALTAGITS